MKINSNNCLCETPKILNTQCVSFNSSNINIVISVDFVAAESVIQAQLLDNDYEIIQDYNDIAPLEEISQNININISNFNNISYINFRIQTECYDISSLSTSEKFYIINNDDIIVFNLNEASYDKNLSYDNGLFLKAKAKKSSKSYNSPWSFYLDDIEILFNLENILYNPTAQHLENMVNSSETDIDVIFDISLIEPILIKENIYCSDPLSINYSNQYDNSLNEHYLVGFCDGLCPDGFVKENNELGEICSINYSDSDFLIENSIFIPSNFNDGDNGWTCGAANFNLQEENDYILDCGLVNSPSEIDQQQSYLLQGLNKDPNNLFLYLKKELNVSNNILPSTSYMLFFDIVLASNFPNNSVGQNVVIKAGASVEEPINIMNDQFVGLNIDIGEYSEEGANSVILDNIINFNENTEDLNYYSIRTSSLYSPVETSNEGKFWIFVGLHSNLANLIQIYIQKINIQIIEIIENFDSDSDINDDSDSSLPIDLSDVNIQYDFDVNFDWDSDSVESDFFDFNFVFDEDFILDSDVDFDSEFFTLDSDN